ncbi:class I SAM-dependent methyltransferase [Microbacterium sediminis]|uniref:Uncharacterized protein n=1 Tax=Microbacterium sediminis TaxID=904291 RepID=A0A1B9NC64_9MICO|nr:class I SAM-dependent methyltransferase [Microbacterium sediminis]OCG74195.1 hypothetical protein A7J15_04875 [Microbacterium sediminis]QBR73552.1 class I SAM-dependent methyltransferase [Microbacterium sediminis]
MTEADWPAYYRRVAGRAVRPFAVRAAAATSPGFAVDLGCGDGTESQWLVEQGWRVLAVDREEEAIRRVTHRTAGRAAVECADLANYTPPAADLVLACAALPFIPPDRFDDAWARIRGAVRPGGILAVELFGDRDSWAGDPGMTFHSRADVEGLTAAIEIVLLEEREFDGPSGRGPKHWHRFEVIARA